MMDIADAIMESDGTDGAINDPKTKVIRSILMFLQFHKIIWVNELKYTYINSIFIGGILSQLLELL